MKFLATMLAAAAVVWPAAHAGAAQFICKGECEYVEIERIDNPEKVYFHLHFNGGMTHANMRWEWDDSNVPPIEGVMIYQSQLELSVGFGETQRVVGRPGPWLSAQGCRRGGFLEKSTCTRWRRFRFERVEVSAPPGPVISSIGKHKAKKPPIKVLGKAKPQSQGKPGFCKTGYVWRDAADGDGVCVTPQERAVAKAQNTNARARRQAGGGAYGPNTCKQGYVWREAFSGDVVCVTPKERADARRQNREASSHTN